MATIFKSHEERNAARDEIGGKIDFILARVAADTEGVESLGNDSPRWNLASRYAGTLKTVPGGTLIHFELKEDSRASTNWFRGKFASLQITLDRWTGKAVRRSVKIDGTELPEGAEAKIEEKARELVKIALQREAQRQEARKVADQRKQAAFHARLEARDAGFSPKPRYDGAVDLTAPDATYEFGEKYGRRVEVRHDRAASRLTLTLNLSPAKLTETLELARKIQALIDEAGV